MTGTMEAAAFSYAAHGWAAFVLSAGKVPVKNCADCAEHTTPAAMEACECLSCHGFYAATRDPDRLREMLRRLPRGLLAVRTGAASGLAVVDVDFATFDADGTVDRSDPGWRTLSELDRAGLLPGTVMQMTGGGGLHLLYAHPGGYLMSGAGKFGPQVDSKADGGYVLVAPSRGRSGTPYAWTGDGRFDHPLPPLPESLCARLRPPAPSPVRTVHPAAFARPGVGRARFAAVLQRALDAPAGERNDLLWWAAKVAGEMIGAGELAEVLAVEALQQVGRQVGLTDSEIGNVSKGTIGSGLRRGRAAA